MKAHIIRKLSLETLRWRGLSGFGGSSLRACVMVAALVCLAVSCAVGPDYKRPGVDAPAAYRKADSMTNLPPGAASFADEPWFKVFNETQLQAFIREALSNSWDVHIAAARVLQAEASLRIPRSQFFPSIAAGGDLLTARTSEKGPVPLPPGSNPQREFGDVFVGMSPYEIDLWGRIRRANEGSRALLLATEEAQRSVRQRLVSDVATTFLELLELDQELEIAYRTEVNRTNSLALTQSREAGGVAGLQDVYQAQILVFTAQGAIADTLRRIEQKENAMSILLGRNPGKIERNTTMAQEKVRADVPPGLPSSLLERRPDVRSAEHQLVAANANIGEAKAAFYPQITLTGFYGFQSVALSDLFTGGARNWQFGPAVTVPLFNGGRLRGNLKLSQARFEEALAVYRQTVQGAFRDVSDGLIGYQRTAEFRQKQEERTQANRGATELAYVRYEGGVTSYLEVLYNEQELFTAELGLAQARRNELLSVVQLYRALGGGWAEPEQHVAADATPRPITKR